MNKPELQRLRKLAGINEGAADWDYNPFKSTGAVHPDPGNDAIHEAYMALNTAIDQFYKTVERTALPHWPGKEDITDIDEDGGEFQKIMQHLDAIQALIKS